MTLKNHVHPFPARMAPDVALEKIEALSRPGDVVLDPMCGSGTVLRLAVEEGRQAIGCDMDPLAVMIARTACKPSWSEDLEERAEELVASSRRLTTSLPAWIARDTRTKEFVEFWFAEPQRRQLSQLARALSNRPSTDDPLRVALSRLIITKEGGASLARDAAHSRPHRVRTENAFNVGEEFIDSTRRLEKLAEDLDPDFLARIRTADARSMSRFLAPGSIDLVVTSPPYLNAIDYLRGHRLSLVWFGHTLDALGSVRRESIGAERGLSRMPDSLKPIIDEVLGETSPLELRTQRMIWRFVGDLERLAKRLSRVVKKKGHVVFVVADSTIRGVKVLNSLVCQRILERHGFRLAESLVRALPTQHRYLPPPSSGDSTLRSRMREELVLTFRKVR